MSPPALPRLSGRRVLVGVSGSIAAYKAADLVRQLRHAGAEVRVVMTRGATAFVTPLTFEALSAHPVLDSALQTDQGAIGHVELAYWAEALVVAPATAQVLAKLAAGLADDALTTTALSVNGPLLVAPAMESRMWHHPATQHNVATLRDRGAVVVGPARGDLASGRAGDGRLVEPADIVAAVGAALGPGDYAGRVVLVTAGPTAEDLDPVRYLTNRSSGKMGYALAQAAAGRGAEVVLIHGPTALPAPAGVEMVAVRSAQQMHDAVFARRDRADVIIMAAAVADYRPAAVSEQKRKKGDGPLTIAFERTPDILAALGASDFAGTLVGFAAETENIEAYAKDKLARKQCDVICANDVSAGQGFGAEDNHLRLFFKDGRDLDLGRGRKAALAQRILDEVRPA